jgi:hypothetical protein
VLTVYLCAALWLRLWLWFVLLPVQAKRKPSGFQGEEEDDSGFVLGDDEDEDGVAAPRRQRATQGDDGVDEDEGVWAEG